MGYYKMVKALVKTNPLPLLAIKDKVLLDYAESLLPYSVGLEFECSLGDQFNHDNKRDHIAIFRAIPDIMNVDTDTGEQRYRIPPGIKGLVCLYRICELLKIHSLENTESGIHYHIDFTDKPKNNPLDRNYFKYLVDPHKDSKSEILIENETWILRALTAWKYTGSYNAKRIGFSHDWVRLSREFNTFEFRIGDMSFDYSYIIKRILNLQSICKRLKQKVDEDIEKKAIPTPKVKETKVVGLSAKKRRKWSINTTNRREAVQGEIVSRYSDGYIGKVVTIYPSFYLITSLNVQEDLFNFVVLNYDPRLIENKQRNLGYWRLANTTKNVVNRQSKVA